MTRWIQIGILAVLSCACAFGQSDNSKPEGGQPSNTQDSTNPQQPAPVSPGQQTSPPEVQKPSTEPSQSTTGQPPTTPAPKATGTTPPKKSGHAKTVSKKKSPSKQDGKPNSDKVVVRNGGARESSPQLSPAMTNEQALHSRENTAQLLATTNANLEAAAGHQLSATQQAMVDQIHAYVRQSKAASVSGDLTRAHTLAYKAHLLSDELAHK